MAENSPIEWTDHTWSPWEGCTKVSPGCDHCYAEGMNRWLRKGENWGPGAPRREYSDEHWKKPLAWAAKAARSGRMARVFPSVCDPFDNAVPAALRERFWQLVYATADGIEWLLLTKRIGNVAGMVPAHWLRPGCWPAHVFLGATIVDQEEADRDIPKLLATPARVRFLSMEPLLGPVTLPGFDSESSWCPICSAIVPDSLSRPHEREHGVDVDEPYDADRHCSWAYDMLHWVIAGGESGPHARPMHPDWARSLRDQCAAAGVPFLFKQWGEWVPWGQQPAPMRGPFDASNARYRRMTHAGNDVSLERVGKKVAGRLLDGVEHNGFPGISHA